MQDFNRIFSKHSLNITVLRGKEQSNIWILKTFFFFLRIITHSLRSIIKFPDFLDHFLIPCRFPDFPDQCPPCLYVEQSVRLNLYHCICKLPYSITFYFNWDNFITNLSNPTRQTFLKVVHRIKRRVQY